MLCSDTLNDLRKFIFSLDMPAEFKLSAEDKGDHLTFFMWEDNFKSLTGEQQVSVAKKMIDLMNFTIREAIPANLKVVRINE